MIQPTADTKPIANIIKTMNSGIAFYQEAKQKVEDGTHTGFFNRMIDAKAEAVFELQPYAVKETGDLVNGDDTMVEARKAYTKIADKLTSNSTAFTYVEQLEEVEDRVLEEIDTALKKELPDNCEATLIRVQKRMKECHDEMRMLKTNVVE
ncbi:PA2169 family four-helix-bundle protein [Marinomonas ostreistagni]|uniref:PA2169 family four-helix-bundle protein n=1 Tax=Marinomonas ostreistagni TaxID=359209 RepID=UPI0019528C1A|nr:PA2169 family four-helix-bundle protein [Marinomonas ostreistagni]MBM6550901.1 PA2169 family four-helix-bundle protein [Marinomonas ostreistagni]